MAVKVSWVGEKIAGERYKILARLGEGGMGAVYRAYDARLETEVVLKCPRPEMLDESFRQRFEREIRSLVRLSHPHVVTILDIGHHDEIPFVVMKYLAGGSLKSVIYPGGQAQPQSPRSLRKWLPQIADALDFVHRQSYVHRDVKPANILFDEHGNAFLSDFGLTRVLSDGPQDADSEQLTAAGFLVGTAHYVSPEVVMGKEIDGRADQYSLAVAVFEALTGKVPFQGPTSSAIVVQHVNNKTPSLHDKVADLPPELSEVVAQAMSKHPHKRFPSCADFAEAVLEHCRRSRHTSGSITTASGSGVVISRGEPGNIPCPKCQRILSIKAEFGGRRGVCQYCRSRLMISKDVCELTLVNPTAAQQNTGSIAQPTTDTQPSGLNQRPDDLRSLSLSGGLSRSDDSVVVLEERVFGYAISRKTALILGACLIVMIVAAVLFSARSMFSKPPEYVPAVRNSDT